MNRRSITIVMVVILLCVAVTSEISLQKIPREDPLGRELLYLPSPEMLKIISLGNTGLAADVLYLWSIQYYSLFEPHERFLYLETIYDLKGKVVNIGNPGSGNRGNAIDALANAGINYETDLQAEGLKAAG